MKLLQTILCSGAIPFLFFAQSGPAGVGSSSTNVLWLKADAGTSTTVNGQPVQGWNDQSGNAIDVSQSNAAQRPLFVTALMNGMPAIEFDNVNTTGQNDQFTAPDNPLLDNTSGYSFFTVTRMKGLSGGGQSIISKRTAVDTDEAFMFFFFTGNNLYLDIDGLNNRFNSAPAAFTPSVNYILDAFYDGTLPSASRSSTYNGESLLVTSAENSALVPDKVSPLVIGATHTSDNRAFNGYMSEIIVYRSKVNDAQRTIINNYLSSKYAIALSQNDFYAGDLPANGDYDFEVSGIGRLASGSNTGFASSVSGGFGMNSVSGLDAGDFILAGHAAGGNSQIFTDVAGMTGINNARWQRTWFVDVTNTGSTNNVNLWFDMSDGAMAGTPIAGPSNYVLLFRTGQSGAWTEVSTASSITGDQVHFSGVSLSQDGYYTIGTHDFVISPLPVGILSFEAFLQNERVQLKWETGTEYNTDYFEVQHSEDGESWQSIGQLPAAGNSTQTLSYELRDGSPAPGINYYRLKEVDTDNAAVYSEIRSVYVDKTQTSVQVFPNPASDQITVLASGINDISFSVCDALGQEIQVERHPAGKDQCMLEIGALKPGVYFIRTATSTTRFIRK